MSDNPFLANNPLGADDIQNLKWIIEAEDSQIEALNKLQRMGEDVTERRQVLAKNIERAKLLLELWGDGQ